MAATKKKTEEPVEDKVPDTAIWSAKRNLGYLGLDPAKYDLQGLARRIIEERPNSLRHFAVIAAGYKA